MSQTVGRLWSRYFEVRRQQKELAEDESEQRRMLDREADQLRDRLLVNYSPLVKYVAGRVGGRMTGTVDQQDFLAWGILGLLSAIRTYDPGRGAKFESYAMSKIRWSILDEFRKEDWVPRRVRSHIQQTEIAKVKITQQLRRPPTEEELARSVGVSVEKHRSMLEQYSRAAVWSLEARIESEDGAGSQYGELVEDGAATDPQDEVERNETRSRLVDALERLAERERLVATFYFYEGLTLKEIGKAMNLTEGRISQILRRALERLRADLSEGPAFPLG
ncbi:MAG TPA: FliA/WhiG family RNA polymerase sigma factor [Rubrobacteraceae bacterium]|nr:FliA/WhiG family RNA polymerase sigma factor [Rubrobacteraceae bacterium]